MNGITLIDLKRSFGKNTVLDISHAEIPSGTVCLFGRSGCGKTTLARIISGLEKADSGSITGVYGNVTYMFQEPRLFPAYSALENVCCVSSKDGAKERAIKLLSFLGFEDDDMKKYPSELSGGMQQRVSLSRAILFFETHGGNTVILDEPFKGLDPDTKKLAAEAVKKHFTCENLIVITHEKSDSALLAGTEISFEALVL